MFDFDPLMFIMNNLSRLKRYENTPEYKNARIQDLERQNHVLTHDSRRLQRIMNAAISRGERKKSMKFCNRLAANSKGSQQLC